MGAGVQDVFNLLPNLGVEELTRAFAVKGNDMMLVIYLASLVRSVLALHNLLCNKVWHLPHSLSLACLPALSDDLACVCGDAMLSCLCVCVCVCMCVTSSLARPDFCPDALPSRSSKFSRRRQLRSLSMRMRTGLRQMARRKPMGPPLPQMATSHQRSQAQRTSLASQLAQTSPRSRDSSLLWPPTLISLLCLQIAPAAAASTLRQAFALHVP